MSAAAANLQAAITSAPGRAGIASVRVAGPDAHVQLLPILGAGSRRDGGSGGLRVLSLGDPASGEGLDRAVVRRRRIDGLDLIDLHLHGSRAVVDRLLEILEDLGAAIVPAARLLELEGIASGRSPRAARMLALLPVARGLGACDCLLAQAGLDLREWDAAPGAGRDRIAALVRDALDRRRLGRACLAPPQIAVVGAANAGKSSLVNVLAGRERALVDADPGTTRDVIAVGIVLGGFEVELLDTAGDRESESAPEREGQRLGRLARSRADLVLGVADGRLAPAQPDAETRPDLTVLTRADLAGCRSPAGAHEIAVSTVDGRGLDELRRRLVELLVLDTSASRAGLVPVGAREEGILEELASSSGHTGTLLKELLGPSGRRP